MHLNRIFENMTQQLYRDHIHLLMIIINSFLKGFNGFSNVSTSVWTITVFFNQKF